VFLKWADRFNEDFDAASNGKLATVSSWYPARLLGMALMRVRPLFSPGLASVSDNGEYAAVVNVKDQHKDREHTLNGPRRPTVFVAPGSDSFQSASFCNEARTGVIDDLID